jgi:glycosyltransferase involved in cell wall biosynthesis
VTRVLQFVPTLEHGGVGDHILQVDRLLRDKGVETAIFAQVVRPDLKDRGRDFADYGRSFKARPDDVLLYHVAQGAALGDFVLGRAERLVLDHHNITPERYFRTWAPEQVHNLAWGRRQLARLAPKAVLGLGDSTFNAQELAVLGCPRIATAPIILDLSAFETAVDEDAVARLTTDATAWFFGPGRWAPNKCQHDLVKAFAVYRQVYDPDAVLRIVGSRALDSYFEAVSGLVTDLGLDDVVELAVGVSSGVAAAHFRTATVQVSVSEHEGFWVPALESMHHRLPVVAYGTGAVPETVGDGGLVLRDKAPATVAAAVHRVVSDPELRTALADAGERHLATFDLSVTRERMWDALSAVL